MSWSGVKYFISIYYLLNNNRKAGCLGLRMIDSLALFTDLKSIETTSSLEATAISMIDPIPLSSIDLPFIKSSIIGIAQIPVSSQPSSFLASSSQKESLEQVWSNLSSTIGQTSKGSIVFSQFLVQALAFEIPLIVCKAIFPTAFPKKPPTMSQNTTIQHNQQTELSGNIFSKSITNQQIYDDRHQNQIIIFNLSQLILTYIIMNSNQKGPLTPQELYHRLINKDYKESQCVDESAKILQQRRILIQLNLQYEEEIAKAQLIFLEEQPLAERKEQLLYEIEAIQNEKRSVQIRIGQQLESLRISPVEMRDQATWIQQVSEARARNNKIRIRIKDLMAYIVKLQIQNRRLQQQKKVISVNDMARRQVGDNWRLKIQALKNQHLSYEFQLKKKIQNRQEQSLRSIEAQEIQMNQRNRQRIKSLRMAQGYNHYKNYQNLHSREQESFRNIEAQEMQMNERNRQRMDGLRMAQGYTPYKNLQNLQPRQNRQNLSFHGYRKI